MLTGFFRAWVKRAQIAVQLLYFLGTLNARPDENFLVEKYFSVPLKDLSRTRETGGLLCKPITCPCVLSSKSHAVDESSYRVGLFRDTSQTRNTENIH